MLEKQLTQEEYNQCGKNLYAIILCYIFHNRFPPNYLQSIDVEQALHYAITKK